MIKQISVFLENEPGRLLRVTRVLADADIDIRALTIAETADFGILRLIVNDPDRAYRILKDENIAVVQHDVLGVEVEDKPGGLARIVDILAKKNVNIEYVYAFVTKSHEKAAVVLRVDDAEKAIEALNGAGVRLITSGDFYSI